MTERQIEILIHFVHRMPMYIQKIERESIVNYMAGFEGGADCNHWTKGISKKLDSKYGIPRVNLGWPYQLQKHSDSNSTSWTESFKEILLEVIREDPNFGGNHRSIINTFYS